MIKILGAVDGTFNLQTGGSPHIVTSTNNRPRAREFNFANEIDYKNNCSFPIYVHMEGANEDASDTTSIDVYIASGATEFVGLPSGYTANKLRISRADTAELCVVST